MIYINIIERARASARSTHHPTSRHSMRAVGRRGTAPSIDTVHVREVKADMVDLVGVVLRCALLALARDARIDA